MTKLFSPMKKRLTLLGLAVFISAFSFAQINFNNLNDAVSDTIARNDLVDSLFNGKPEIIFKFKVQQKEELFGITAIVSIDNYNSTTKEVTAYANKQDFKNFLSLGIPYSIIEKPIGKAYVMATSVADFTSTYSKYPTYSQYDELMTQFETDHPTLCKRYDLGTTINGHKIIALKVTSNVSTKQQKVKVLYESSLHGDEVTGMVLMLRMIDYLTTQYVASDPQAVNILDNIEIWFLPDQNPDGTYKTSDNSIGASPTSIRGNANSIDCNRNFPDFVGGPHPDGREWQDVTLINKAFQDTSNFTLALQYHGGTEVFNYYYDTYTSAANLPTDDAWWRYVGGVYVASARANATGGCGAFTNTDPTGVTEGGDWYWVFGGAQDYANYYNRDRFAYLEVSVPKTPQNTVTTPLLSTFWTVNYQAMLLYLEESLYGLRGVITDATDGDPVVANITIAADKDHTDVYSGASFGDYYRLISAGTHNVTYSAPGYVPQTINGISVSNGAATVQNVALVRATPVADFIADKTSSVDGKVVFTNTSTAMSNATWLWTFGDGNTSTEKEPIHYYTASGTYSVTLNLYSEAGNTNVTKTNYITVTLPSAPSVTPPAAQCGSGSFSLTATGGTIYNWYDAPTGGNLLYTGANYNTPVISTTTTYYVENEIKQATSTMGKAYAAGTNQTNSPGAWYLKFDALEPIRLESVVMNPSTTTARLIQVHDDDNNLIASKLWTPAATGSQTVTLDFFIPKGTDYKISARMNGTGAVPNLSYSTSGFTFPTAYSLINIKGSFYATTGPLPTYNTYYMYFYDWAVAPASQRSARTAVTCTINPSVAASVSIAADPGNEICSGTSVTFTATPTNGGTTPTYQWKKNGTPLAGATNATYITSSLSDGDNITCVMTSNAPCVTGSPATSNTISILVLPMTPAISNVVQTPTSVSSLNTVSVSADVRDCYPITSVTLKWCTDGVTYGNSISMSLGASPTYTTSSDIPAQSIGTTVYYKIEAVDNMTNTTLTSAYSYTVSDEPSNHATSFSCGTSTNVSIQLTWTDATGGVIPTAYLIKGSSVSFAAITDPVDGTPVANGALVHNVAAGTQEITFSGLSASTTYYFKIYPYTGSGAVINYKVTPAAPQLSCSTTGSVTTIVTWNFPNNPDDANCDAGISANYNPPSYKTITNNATGSTVYNLAGATTNCASNTGWDAGMNLKKWEFNFSTLYYNDLKVSSQQYSSSGGSRGPQDFNIEYSTNGTNYYLVTSVPAISNNWTSGVVTDAAINTACDNQSSVYLRWIMSSDLRVGGGTPISAAGTNQIDNIIVTGSPLFPSAAGSITGTGTVCKGDNGVAYSIGAIANAASYIWVLPPGASLASGSGTNSITVNFSGSAVSGNISVYGTNPNGDGLPSLFPVTVNACTNTWTGTTSTDWSVASNWGLGFVPDQTFDVVIPSAPSNQPHITSSPATPAQCKNLTIDPSATLTIDAGKALTASGNTVVNGSLIIESNASGTGSFIDNGTVTGNVTVKKFLTFNRWWYLGSPLSNGTGAAFSTLSSTPSSGNRLFYWNEATHAYVNVTNTGDALPALRGYSFKRYTASDLTASFTGTLNTGTIGGTANLTYNAGTSAGFNLVCNPYASAINWGSQGSPTAGLTQTNIATSIWYRKDGSFATYNWTTGIGANGGQQYIPAMQAFWVRTLGSTGGLQLTNATRVHNSQAFYKESSENNVFRLSLSDGLYTDETVVAFFTEATAGDDAFDSEKMFVTDEDVPQIFTATSDYTFVAINGQEEVIPGVERVVPLGFSSNISGTFTLQATNMDVFNPAVDVYLEDSQLNYFQNLSVNGTYSFTSGMTDNSQRFKLHFGSVLNGISSFDENTLLLYVVDNSVYINTSVNRLVEVYNTIGEKIAQQQVYAGLSKIPLTVSQGVYIVKTLTGAEVTTKKVFIGK